MLVKSSWSASCDQLQQRLHYHLKFKLDLVVNENRTIMLNMLGRRRLSIHRMFFDAPDEVIKAVASYVLGREKKASKHILRVYIQNSLQQLDYSHRVDKTKLKTDGRIYNLVQIMDEVNAHYFDSALNLSITWYGMWGMKRRRRITFGEYHDSLKLIKIHRMLDDPFFPHYFVSFVVYHEMLHHVTPGRRDERGFFSIHTAEFKQKERLFAHYAKATAFEKRNKETIFGWA